MSSELTITHPKTSVAPSNDLGPISRLVIHPAMEPAPGSELRWAIAPGFAGNPHELFTLSQDPTRRHPASAFYEVRQDDLVTVVPPPMSGWNAYIPHFIKQIAEGTDAAVLVGLSHGGAFMNAVYRLWRAQPPGQRKPERLGLVLWSVPPTPGELRWQAWIGLKIACLIHPAFLTDRLTQSTFIRLSERREVIRNRDLGPNVLAIWRGSVARSAPWWPRTLREVNSMHGLGPAIDPQGSVVSLNVEAHVDNGMRLPKVLAAIRSSYPGTPNFEVTGAHRHAIPEIDGPRYAQALADIRTYFLGNWGLL